MIESWKSRPATTNETRKKQSESQKKRNLLNPPKPMTQAQKDKLSIAMLGKKQDPEMVKKRIAKATATRMERQSRDRREFEARCASMFNNETFQLMLII